MSARVENCNFHSRFWLLASENKANLAAVRSRAIVLQTGFGPSELMLKQGKIPVNKGFKIGMRTHVQLVFSV
jgi:hypothetical protein